MPAHLQHAQARPGPEMLLINLSSFASLCASPISGCWPPECQIQQGNRCLIRILQQHPFQQSGPRSLLNAHECLDCKIQNTPVLKQAGMA